MSDRLWPRLVQGVLVLALPLCLLVADARLVTGQWFVRWEYGKAGFPPDTYGFSTPERTRLAEACVDYLVSGADITLLSDLRLADGRVAFNERELRHMADVQAVFGGMMLAGDVAGLVLVGGLLALAVPARTRRRAPVALLSGSLFTLMLLGALGLFMLVSWWRFFEAFHGLFFQGDSWLFEYSDTLIRLFPMRFWIDAAATIIALLIVEVSLIGGAGWVWMRRGTFTKPMESVR
jgi:integral membrane protein (TIGR01906 family)